MGSGVIANIPPGLYSALEKSTSKFPLRPQGHLEPLARKLEKIVPSFRSKQDPLESSPSVQYDKIKTFLKSHHSATLYERHVSVLEKLARVLKNGIV